MIFCVDDCKTFLYVLKLKNACNIVQFTGNVQNFVQHVVLKLMSVYCACV